jgi:hypothetical protein
VISLIVVATFIIIYWKRVIQPIDTNSKDGESIKEWVTTPKLGESIRGWL